MRQEENFVNRKYGKCRWSMIMSVVNWSGKMSVWRDERETDIELREQKRVVVLNEVGKGKMVVREAASSPNLNCKSKGRPRLCP